MMPKERKRAKCAKENRGSSRHSLMPLMGVRCFQMSRGRHVVSHTMLPIGAVAVGKTAYAQIKSFGGA